MIAYNRGLVVDTLSQAGAGMAGWERKSGMVLGHLRESGFAKTKNSTNEASMLLKAKRGSQKRTQNELKTNPKLSAQMREVEPKFEVFGIARVGAGNWIVGDAAGTGFAGLGETRGAAREFKNTENKAKKWLKTKDISFLKAANQESLTRQSAQIRPGREQGTRQFGKIE